MNFLRQCCFVSLLLASLVEIKGSLIDVGCAWGKRYIIIGGASEQSWSASIDACNAEEDIGTPELTLVSMDSESERSTLLEILDNYTGRQFWTQGALVVQYSDGTVVNTDFKSDEYPFSNSTKNPSWCLALVRPADNTSPILKGTDCQTNLFPLCQFIDSNC